MAVKLATDRGEITITNRVIAKIAKHIAQSCYGVVGLAAARGKGALRGLLKHREGVAVKTKGKDISIELHITSEYGVNVKAVSKSVTSSVRYQIEHMTGCRVGSVNVTVDTVRVD